MPSLRDIKRRIRSVKNTQQITKAMKLVSASKLRRAQEAILSARPYALRTMDVMNHLAARSNPDLHPLLQRREEKRILLLVISSDKGLCGGFNSNIFRRTLDMIRKNPDKEVSLIIAGRKGQMFFQSRAVKVLHQFVGWSKNFKFSKAAEIADMLSQLFIQGAVDKIYVVYNEFKSVIQQQVVVEQLLPIVPEESKDKEAPVDYIYEPDEEGILNRLLTMYMNVEVYRAFLESSASEHGARMTAMDNATRNASDMIGELTLYYNKARQAYITKELIEIVSGAEALKA
jgi:F-type H+-transporting ATPase subunit gamma